MLHAMGIDHITITVNDLVKSEPFYDQLMTFLGLKKMFSEYGFAGWKNSCFNFYISEAEATHKNEQYTSQRAGLNHLSFKAQRKEDVDILYDFLLKKKNEIIHPPKWLKQYGQKLYYVAFLDPDGIKVEFGYSE